MLDNFRLCPRKFYYRMVLHLISPTTETYKMEFGTAIHNAFDAWYRGQGPAAMDKAFIDHYLPFDGLCTYDIRTLAYGLHMLELFRKKFPLEDEPFIPKYIEIGFTAELGPFLYCGRMDGVVEWNRIWNGLVILEHKTSARKGYLLIKPNSQFIGYIWGASEQLSQPVLGVYLNAVYLYKKAPEFVRELAEYTPAHVEEWKQETIQTMTLINNCCEKGIWLKTTKNCTAYGKRCEYIELCNNMDEGIRQNIINTLLVEEKWNPHPEARKGEK
jgi:hypothetical protein